MMIWYIDDNDDIDNDKELLLIDIEKKMEWYKIMELFNTKIWINRIEESIILWDYSLSNLNSNLIKSLEFFIEISIKI